MFFLIRNYFIPIKNQFMILLLKKLSLNKFATLQLSLNKLAIIYYLIAKQIIYNFFKNCSIKYIFIFGGTNNADYNSPEETANGLITSGLSAQARCQNAKIVIIPLLPHDTKNSLLQGDINVINTLLLSKCLKHNLYTSKHQLEWLNINRSLNLSLFYKGCLHLIKNGNELLAKGILCCYKSLKIKSHNSSICSFKDVTSFLLNNSEFPPLLSGHSTSNHLMLKKHSDPKSCLLPTNETTHANMSLCKYICVCL